MLSSYYILKKMKTPFKMSIKNFKENIMIITIEEFEKKLKKLNLSKNTICSYKRAIIQFYDMYNELTKKNMLAYKGYLLENYQPKTVNLRLLAMNKYLEMLGKNKFKIKLVKIQQKTFLENVISDADYNFLKNKLKKDGRLNWYFVVRYLAATGARVSELIQIKVEHIVIGYLDIYSKGGKIRRIYIPKALRVETLSWLSLSNIKSGYLFLNRFGKKLTTRGVALQLKSFAIEYGLNSKVVYPHSFRHRFAKNFLEKYNDIALLADLMGHESIETTRVYLRKTSNEQQEIVDRIITW